MAQTVKHLPIVRQTQVQSVSWEDLLEKEIATHSSTLAWKIPWTGEPGRLQSMGSQRVGHDWVTSLSLGNKEFMIWATVSSRSCFADCIELLHLWLQRIYVYKKEYYQSDFSVDHLVMSMYRDISCFVGRGCLLWPVCSVGKTLLDFTCFIL